MPLGKKSLINDRPDQTRINAELMFGVHFTTFKTFEARHFTVMCYDNDTQEARDWLNSAVG